MPIINLRVFLTLGLLCLLACPSHGALAPRSERVKAYEKEFVSEGIRRFPYLFNSVDEVLMRLPEEIFSKISRRENPVIFTEYFDSGKARLADSSAVKVLPEDPPTFTQGFYLIKLSSELERHPKAAKAVIAHEIAHHVTRYAHSKEGDELEKAANRLIRRWGFGRELQEARKVLQ